MTERMTKASRTGKSIHMQSMGRPTWTPRDYAQLAKESYQMNAVSYRSVRLVAEAAASVTIKVMEGDKEMADHPFKELLGRPNPFESRHEFLVRQYSFLLLAGQAYVEPVLIDGAPEELFVLRPDRMSISVGRTGYPSLYTYKVGQSKTEYRVPSGRNRQLPILHIKEFHPTDDLYGMSPVEAAAYSIDVHNQANKFGKALLDNMARPSGALVYSGGEGGTETLGEEQFARLKKELEDNFQGARNAGRPMLLEGGLDWKEMSLAPKDLEYSESKQQSARDIALSFGVPPQLLGIPGDNTYTNYSQAVRALYRQTVLPLVTHVCDDYTNFFKPSYGDAFKVVPDLDSLEALADERDSKWKRVNDAKHLTVNEKREQLGFAPYKDKAVGESIFGPMNEMPLDANRAEHNGDEGEGNEDPFDDGDEGDDQE